MLTSLLFPNNYLRLGYYIFYKKVYKYLIMMHVVDFSLFCHNFDYQSKGQVSEIET